MAAASIHHHRNRVFCTHFGGCTLHWPPLPTTPTTTHNRRKRARVQVVFLWLPLATNNPTTLKSSAHVRFRWLVASPGDQQPHNPEIEPSCLFLRLVVVYFLWPPTATPTDPQPPPEIEHSRSISGLVQRAEQQNRACMGSILLFAIWHPFLMYYIDSINVFYTY